MEIEASMVAYGPQGTERVTRRYPHSPNNTERAALRAAACSAYRRRYQAWPEGYGKPQICEVESTQQMTLA